MATATRRSDLDWLRVGAIALLVFFHSARVFDVNEAYYVQNRQLSPFLSYGVIGFFSRWGMELLFLISGMASCFALRGRSQRDYLRDRWLRLGIPFVFGVLVLVPPQAYLAHVVNTPEPSGSYWSFLGGYFTDWSDLSGYRGTFTPGQLWFILFLLAFSIIGLPLFRWWSSPARAGVRDQVAGLFSARLALLAWTVPLAVVTALPGVGGKNLLGYLLYFVLGYVLAATPSYQPAIDRDRHVYAVLGVVSWAAVTAAWVADVHVEAGSPGELGFHVVRVLCTWTSVLALLGYAHTHLTSRPAWLGRANEAAFPVYLVHQTVLVAAADLLVRASLGVTATYLLLVAATFAGSLLTYIGATQVAALRVLFGLKTQVQAPAREGAAAV